MSIQNIHREEPQALNSSHLRALFTKDMTCIAISFYLRSGSYLLHTLLDGHSKILNLPPWASLIYREENLVHSLEAYVQGCANKAFTGHMDRLLRPSKLWEKQAQGSTVHSFVGEQAHIPLDQPHEVLTIFKNHLKVLLHFLQENTLVSRRNYLLSIALAYELAQGAALEQLAQKTHLLYQMHAPLLDFLCTIQEDFKHVFFLQSIRNPLSALASHVEEYALHVPQNISQLFEWVFSHATLPTQLPATHCMAVKNEFLHHYGKPYIQSLLQKMNLAWEDSCAHSTLQGQIFWWTKKGKIFTGLNPHLHDNYCQANSALFDCHDKIILSSFLSPRFKAWGYPPCPSAHFLPILKQAKMNLLEMHKKQAEQAQFIQEYFAHSQIDMLTLHVILSLHFFSKKPVFTEHTEAIIQAFVRGLQQSKTLQTFMPLAPEEDCALSTAASTAMQNCTYTV